MKKQIKRTSVLLVIVLVVFNIKIKAQKFQWIHPYCSYAEGLDIVNDNLTGLYFCGWSRSSNFLFDSIPVYWYGYEDGIFCKTDTLGNIEWIHNLGSGGSLESAQKIVQWSNNLYLQGNGQYGVTIDTTSFGNMGGYLASFDTSGPLNSAIVRPLGDFDVFNSGTIYSISFIRPFPGAPLQYYLSKLNTNGMVTDSLFLFQTNISYAFGNKLICDSQSNIILETSFSDSINFLGTTYHTSNQYDFNYLLMKCDSDFNVLSIKRLSGNGHNPVLDMIINNQGLLTTISSWIDTVYYDGILIPGSGQRLELSTYDDSLNLLNHINLDLHGNNNAGLQLKQNDVNEYYIGLNFVYNYVIGSDTLIRNFTGYNGIGVIAKYSAAGQLVWYREVAQDSTASYSTGTATIKLSQPQGNKIYVTGQIKGNPIIDTTVFTGCYAGAAAYTALLIDTTYGMNTGIMSQSLSENFITDIFPNPSSGTFDISFKKIIPKGKVEIVNILGVPIDIGIAENIFNESKKEINLKNISSGIYFVKVFDGEKYYCRKIIIEQD